MNVVVTGGGTVAPIDDVRQITNVSTGRFSAAISEACLKRGAAVWHVHTPQAQLPFIRSARFELTIREEMGEHARLERLHSQWRTVADRLHLVPLDQATVADYSANLERVLRAHPIDVAFLAMAVSDFEPEPYDGKLDSDVETTVIRCRPTPKVIRSVRDWAPGIYLVGFKLLSHVDMAELIHQAETACRINRADLTVANDLQTLQAGSHTIHLVRPGQATEMLGPDDALAESLVDRVFGWAAAPRSELIVKHTMNEPLPREGDEKGIGVYLLFCAVAALWVDFGSLHRLHNGDSLLPVLVSLQYWTPFQWELDRHGMLVPLLALPVTHPLANLLVQGFLDVFCGLAAFFLLARYMLRDSIDPLVGALGATAFLTLAPAPYRFDYLMDVSYGVWLTLGLGGLIVAEPEPGVGARTWGRRLVALVLIILAHWVYSATALYLVTLVVFRTLFSAGFRQRAGRFFRSVTFTSTHVDASAARGLQSAPAQAMLLMVTGFLAGRALTTLSIHPHTTFARIPPGQWQHAWTVMFVQTRRALAPGVWPLALVSTAVLTVVVNLVRVRLRRPLPGQGSADSLATPWREAAALVSTALVVALYMGTRLWLKLNIYAPRYLLPSVLLTQAALVMLIVKPLGYAIMTHRVGRVPIVVATLLLLGVTWAYGLPSPRRVRADIDRLSALTPDVLAAGCTHIAGNYWTVWPAIYHVNLALYERGESRTVWGVTFGGQPTSTLWRTIPQEKRCVCIPLNDPYGDNWLLSFGFSRFRDVRRRATVRVLRREAVSATRLKP